MEEISFNQGNLGKLDEGAEVILDSATSYVEWGHSIPAGRVGSRKDLKGGVQCDSQGASLGSKKMGRMGGKVGRMGLGEAWDAVKFQLATFGMGSP